MILLSAYRGIIELDTIDEHKTPIDGRFLVRAGWTVLTPCGGQVSEICGPTSAQDTLSLRSALDLDVLQRTGPSEDGRPNRRLGHVGHVGCLRLWGPRGLIVTPEDAAS